MKLWTTICLLLCVPLPAVAAGENRPFSDAEYWAGVWEDPSRADWQKPIQIFEVLAIEKGDVIADLGAGTGYFTRPLAIAVGDAGRVYAVDVEQELLDYVMARTDIPPGRVVPILAKANDPMLPPGEIDLVLTVNTWHHIKKRGVYLKRLAASLKPDGRVVVIDFHLGEFPVGPKDAEKVSRDRTVREFETAGWTLAAESLALPYQYFLTFYPPTPAPAVLPATQSD